MEKKIMKELNFGEMNNQKVTNEFYPEKKNIKQESTESFIEKNNEVMWQWINLFKQQVKLSHATIQYLLKVLNFTIVDNETLQKQIYDYADSVADFSSLLDKINHETTFKEIVKSKESCDAAIIKSKNLQEKDTAKNVEDSNSVTTESQPHASSGLDKNYNTQVDIEVLNKSISLIDLNSPDEPMNIVDIDVDPKQTDSALHSSLSSSHNYSPSVILEKIAVPVNNGISSNPVVSGNEKSKEVLLEGTDTLVEPDKKLNLVDALKKKLYSDINQNSGVKSVKRKATDEKISLKNSKRRYTDDENNDNSLSQQSTTWTTERKVLKAKICPKKQEFNVPQSFLPVVRLHRIKVPADEVNSTIKTKIKKLETTGNVYNLRQVSRKSNRTGIKKTNSNHINSKEKSQHVKKNFKCKKCNYESNFQGSFRRHVKIHKEDAVPAMQSDTKHLTKYLQHFDVNKSKSSTSSSIAKSLELLKEHTKKDNSNKLFTCNDCDKSFGNKKSLREHRVASHDSPRSEYSCDKCQLTFSYYGRLSRHFRNCSGSAAGNAGSKTVN